MPDQKTIDRFYSYIQIGEEDACWLWTGTLSKDGYGHFRLKRTDFLKVSGIDKRHGGIVFAHKLVYFLLHRYYPRPPDYVLHTCDIPNCVNLKHLYLGTQQQNVQDRVDRDRSWQPIGTTNSQNKLSENQVLEIRKRRQNGETTRKLGLEYGVCHQLISEIANKRLWKHLS